MNAPVTSDLGVTNIVIAGLGGQGVLKASDILVDAIFPTGLEVKKSEVHGMSQRGGSVCSDIRFGRQVFSPMVPPGEADYLLVLAPDQVEVNRHLLKPDGVLIAPDSVDINRLPNKKALNVALLGRLSRYLEMIPLDNWRQALQRNFPPDLHAGNEQAFEFGRNS
ncbi:2-oxoacid:acceptor oxidoreductase family protein [Fontisphaera persica]|uniref:2-oxoacid:acceptor oxidoreductase family protein n=1 Tax=Fontisphaera persica TaxID=2974023 RepID=UPI0024BFED0D|nr:2-oxoacid:acceptor oxidoreductase family protein [Fontisphaera persica]WCJ60025.1 2-oxoacid:acceptor oxidoreductase family protein [Fontisphaera persica]